MLFDYIYVDLKNNENINNKFFDLCKKYKIIIKFIKKTYNYFNKNSCLLTDNFSYWKTKELKNYILFLNNEYKNNIIFNKEYLEFNSLNILFDIFNNFYKKINNMTIIGKYCGERFDLTQAGGGNISFKQHNLLVIKSSGIKISEISNKNGYTILLNNKIKNKINIFNEKLSKKEREQCCKKIMMNNLIIKTQRPSIETTLHSILKTYTIHLHPIQVNILTVQKNAYKILSNIFPNALIINYHTPGIDLALNIKKKYNNEKIIFLLNHGVIFTTDNKKEIINLIKNTINKIEKIINITFNKYKLTNKISKIYDKLFNNNLFCYLSEDFNLINNIKILSQMKSLYPDYSVYCGYKCLYMYNLNKQIIINYYNKYKTIPKILIINKNIYIVGNSLNKCKDIEDVLKGHLLVYKNSSNYKIITNDEINYLNNWEAEKYRQL